MPKGPQGQKRPADVIGNAIMVARIATGQEIETLKDPKEAQKIGGKLGGKMSASKLTPEERKKRALNAAKAKWKKKA